MRKIIYTFLLFAAAFSLHAQDTTKSVNKGWRILVAQGTPVKREDCSFVEVHGEFYLLGGRGINPVDVFDPATNTWQHKGNTPIEMHHFQAVAYKRDIYVVGGMTGGYPHEKPLGYIYIYNTETDEWHRGPAMPAARLRGSGGTVVYKNKIYLVCGIQDGHYDGNVKWMDVFDPSTGKWQTLPDAPHARDHFNAVVIGHKLYLAGGRRTSAKTNQVTQLTVAEVDVFDLKNQTWTTLSHRQNIPTLRAGCAAIAFKHKLVVIGGESSEQQESHHQVEAFDADLGMWSNLPGLETGRHDTGAIIYKGAIYIAAGSANRGGGPDQDTIEVFMP